MSNELPLWISILQALSVPVIAALAAIIGFRQWRTAHQKLGVDLFEKRWETYVGIRKVISKVARHGTATDEDFWDYVRATDRADFLFGDDVTALLKEINDSMAWLSSFRESVADITHPDREELIKAKYKHFGIVTDFYKRAPSIFAQYMRMDEKLPRP